jgi:hypothetical protein
MSFATLSSGSSSNNSVVNLAQHIAFPQPPPSQQDPWAPGLSDRSLRHQRDCGFVYNEDYEESLFNDPEERPSQLELAWDLRARLMEVEEREMEEPNCRDEYWERVARGDFMLDWVRYSRWERVEMEAEEERERQWLLAGEGDKAEEGGSEGEDGWVTAGLVGDHNKASMEQHNNNGGREDGEPN